VIFPFAREVDHWRTGAVLYAPASAGGQEIFFAAFFLRAIALDTREVDSAPERRERRDARSEARRAGAGESATRARERALRRAAATTDRGSRA
jgi:hypothetical protein